MDLYKCTDLPGDWAHHVGMRQWEVNLNVQVLVKEETAELEGAGFDAGVSGSADVAVSSGTSGPWKQEKLKSIISRILWQPDKVIGCYWMLVLVHFFGATIASFKVAGSNKEW